MVKQLWNWAIKARDVDKAVDFYTKVMGAELLMSGVVLNSVYRLIRLGGVRILILDRAPYEDDAGLDLPEGFLHVVYEVDDLDAQVEVLRKTPVRFLVEPTTIHTDFGRRKIAFFESLEGIRTEVMQIETETGNL